jgi:hypothetical protein
MCVDFHREISKELNFPSFFPKFSKKGMASPEESLFRLVVYGIMLLFCSSLQDRRSPSMRRKNFWYRAFQRVGLSLIMLGLIIQPLMGTK